MSDNAKLRLILFIGVMLIGSVIGSCSELRYALNSDHAEAKITRMYEESGTRSRRGTSSPRMLVEYRFTDRDGQVLEGYDRVSLSFEPQLSVDENGQQTVAVQYRPGSEVSRLAGTAQMFWVWILAASVAITIGTVIYFWIDYRKYEQASKSGTSWR